MRSRWIVVVLLLMVALVAGALVARRLLLSPAVVMQEAYPPGAGRANFDHALLDDLLRRHVDAQGRVDYAGLARDQAQLDRYLAALATAPFDDLGRDDKLALLIDAYNAFTLRLVLDHGGASLGSIKDIPADRRWDGRTWTIAGRERTLSQLEHEDVRARFREPRVHFALNCASAGCPPLRAEAYVGARLEAQLEDQARRLHADPRHARLEPGVVRLTRLYDWYGGDFAQVAGSPLAFAARYVPSLQAGDGVTVRWLDYDWRLNGR